MPRTFLSFFRRAQHRNVLRLLIVMMRRNSTILTPAGKGNDQWIRETGSRSVGSAPSHSALVISVMTILTVKMMKIVKNVITIRGSLVTA